MAKQTLLVSRKSDTVDPRASGEGGTWLILADEGGVGVSLSRRLAVCGMRTVLVSRSSSFSRRGEDEFAIDPGEPGHYRRLVELVSAEGAPLRGVLHLWSLDATDVDRLTTEALLSDSTTLSASLLYLTQALAAALLRIPPRLWLVTRGSQSVGDDSGPLQLAQVTVRGLGRVIALEYPEMWGGMLDLEPGPAEEAAAFLPLELLESDGEDAIAYRAGTRFVARLARCQPRAVQETAIRPDGTYLVTGGFGALGLETARWLVNRGARHLALLGRHGPTSPESVRDVESLERTGARIYTGKVDVADEAAVRGVLADLRRDWPPLRGVIHAAGLPGYRPVAEMDRPALEDDVHRQGRRKLGPAPTH